MTDRPYTDADLHHEAARQHKDLTEDFDYAGVGERMGDNKPWGALGDVDFDNARDGIGDLIANAADVSTWAVTLGAAGLKPVATHGVRLTTGDYPVAIQIALDPGLTDDAQAELITAITEAVTATTSRVLGCTPVSEAVNP